MKAVRLHGYGGVDQLRLEEIPTPQPGPGEVLVKVLATSVNPVDWKIRRGDLRSRAPLQFPFIPGRDVAGEVVALGAGVAAFHLGQKVMGLVNHSYAEFLVASAGVLSAIPDGLDPVQAGVLPLVTTTGAELVSQMDPRPGDTVLVTGAAGSVGRAAVFAAKKRGACVIAAVRSEQKPLAESLGADRVVATDSDGDLPSLDAIADTVGPDLVEKLEPHLKPGGVVGSVLGKPRLPAGDRVRIEAVVSHPDAGLLQSLAEAVRDGALAIPIARSFSLAQAAEAQACAERGHLNGKIALIP